MTSSWQRRPIHWLGAEGREQSPGLDDYDDRHHTRGHTEADEGTTALVGGERVPKD